MPSHGSSNVCNSQLISFKRLFLLVYALARIDHFFHIKHHSLKSFVKFFSHLRFHILKPLNVGLSSISLSSTSPIRHTKHTRSLRFSLFVSLDSFSSFSFMLVALFSSVFALSFSFCKVSARFFCF